MNHKPMTIWQLAWKEISRRKMGFILGLLSVTIAVATLVGALTMLKAHDLRTTQIIAQKEQQTRDRMALLEDDYRKIMKILGFNLLILPEEQNLAELYEQDFSSKYMPEEYVSRLAASNILSIRHLLPVLQQRIQWPEQNRTVILIGTRGEVPFESGNNREPMLNPVSKGQMVMGYELHTSLGVKVGDRVKLRNQTFVISQCNEERGTRDDISIWINLAEAQALLNRPKQINAILALKCFCAGNDLPQIRTDVAKILPGTQVIEQGTKVITRAEARDRAAKEAQEAIEAEIQNRALIRREQEAFAAILVPLVLLASVLWIAFLFLSNTRERRSEIGILRAIGVKSKRILTLFLYKALIMAAAGAAFGFVLGVLFGAFWRNPIWSATFIDLRLLVLSLLLATALSLFASWIPALLAAQQDPALVIREE